MVTGAWRRGGGGGRRVLHHCHSPIPLMLRQTMEESCCSTFKRVRVTTETKHRVVFISFLCCLSSFHVLHWRIWCNLITEFQLCFSFLFPSVLLQYPSLSLSGTIRRLIRLSWLFLNTLCWWGSSTGETGGWVGGWQPLEHGSTLICWADLQNCTFCSLSKGEKVEMWNREVWGDVFYSQFQCKSWSPGSFFSSPSEQHNFNVGRPPRAKSFFFVLFSSNPTLSFIISQIFKLPLRGTEKMNPAQRSTSSLTLTVVSPHTPCCVNSV